MLDVPLAARQVNFGNTLRVEAETQRTVNSKCRKDGNLPGEARNRSNEPNTPDLPITSNELLGIALEEMKRKW